MPNLPKYIHGKIGLIAGNGDLPEKVINEFVRTDREIFVININNSEPPSLAKVGHVNLSIGAVGKAIKTLRKENIKKIVFAGGLKRPKFSALRPDAGGVKLLARISKARFAGDNSLLSIVIKFFEDSGFSVLGVEEILDDILMPVGTIGTIEPSQSALKDIELGIDVARSIGMLDIGQSVVVQKGVVLGVEAIEGTDNLIKRCAEYVDEEHGATLVKMKKPTQDKRIDLPTIGVATIINAHQSGLKGIAIEAGAALIVDKKAMVKKADELGLFVVGIE